MSQIISDMTVTRFCPETGDEVEIEVSIDGYTVREDAETGRGWGMEDVGATVHGGTEFYLTSKETDRADELLLGVAEDRACSWNDPS